MKHKKNKNKNLLVWLVLLAGFVFAYNIMDVRGFNIGASEHISFSDFLNKVDEQQVAQVMIHGNGLEGKMNDGSNFFTYAPGNYNQLVGLLKQNNIKFDVAPTDSKPNTFMALVLGWLPAILAILGLVFIMRQIQNTGGKAMGFGKSKAKLIANTKKVTFADVAGIDEAKEELVEIVEFLKAPKKFTAIGAKIPKGCLLIGSPGTGKTLLARAIAGEAGVPFFSISGSDFVEMFVGVGASRVRDMFEQGKKSAPCIIFIDEIDAVGRHRGIGLGGGNDEREQTLNQMLVEMDGFEANEGVIVIAATNRPDVLDPALLRPGRFDRQISVPIPDLDGRDAILNVHAKKVRLGPDVDLRLVARGTPGFSGAELENLCNEAALFAARNNKKVVSTFDFENAKDKLIMGAERKSMKMDDDAKTLTAYHEGGHAIVAFHQPTSDPIHKATIIPRGRALGMVVRMPEKDRFSVTREKLEADLAVAMGGRVAEELIFGYDKITTGASSDIKEATRIAKAMVKEWGMSDLVGPLYHGNDRDDLYSPNSGSKPCSDDTSKLIDEEIKKIIERSYERAKTLLVKHLAQLHLLAKNLLEYETLTGDEIKELLANNKLVKKSTKKKSVGRGGKEMVVDEPAIKFKDNLEGSTA